VSKKEWDNRFEMKEDKEFKLSDCVVGKEEVYEKDKVVHIQNIKEFIKKLKEMLRDELAPEDWYKAIINKIDKLVGEDLK